MIERTCTDLPGVFILQPRVFSDSRGHFFESFNARAFRELVGGAEFVQDNVSYSVKHVLRGMHYQIQRPQGKLVRVISGEIFDVAVDLRRSSPTFGKWTGIHLNSETKKQIWIPAGFAHGFLALSETAEVAYKTTDYYAPEHERRLLWNDPTVGIDWPLAGNPHLAAKDKAATMLGKADTFD